MLAIMADPAIEEKLCINGPYDTGMWRLTSRPQNVPGVSNEVMSAFITVSSHYGLTDHFHHRRCLSELPLANNCRLETI